MRQNAMKRTLFTMEHPEHGAVAVQEVDGKIDLAELLPQLPLYIRDPLLAYLAENEEDLADSRELYSSLLEEE